ncbi:reverse transcriptase domain-containing protein [Tanacetum coccineum]
MGPLQRSPSYNALNPTDQDSLNSGAGGNLLERSTQDVLTIIENKSKVRNSQNKSIVSQVKSSDVNSSSFSDIGKLTHAVNQQTSAVTTAMTAILKQFQATQPPASVKKLRKFVLLAVVLIHMISVSPPMATLFQNIGILFKDSFQQATLTTISGLVLDGPTFPIPPPFVNPEGDMKRVEETLTDPEHGIARDVFVPVGKFTFPADFVFVDYESDPRVPLIFGRPFLRTARALIDVHGEEMILRDGNERLILNMRHDTSSYSTQPHQESINMIDVYNNSIVISPSDSFPLENSNPSSLLPPFHNSLSGSTTSSSHSLPISENSDYSLEEFVDELAHFTFPPEIDYLYFDAEYDL